MALKKKFIEVELPLLAESMSVLGDVETLENRTIKLDLSRKLRGKGMEVIFTIKNTNGKLLGHPKSMILMRSYIQRMMRKRISYVEDSFETTCKDIKITIKPFLITRNKVSRAIRNNLRRTTKELILEYVKDKNYLEIAESVLHGNLQKELHPKLKKIYPLSLCEIRVLETREISKADLTYKKEETQEVPQVKSQIEELEEAKQETTEEKPKKTRKKKTEKEETNE